MNTDTDTKQVPCDICGEATPYAFTRRCNSCWELERRVEARPDLARKILEQIEKEKKP